LILAHPSFFSTEQEDSGKVIDPDRLRVFTGVDAACPKSGPYETSEGIYPGYGQGKNWGRANLVDLMAKDVLKKIHGRHSKEGSNCHSSQGRKLSGV
jgi:hypothetical protein